MARCGGRCLRGTVVGGVRRNVRASTGLLCDWSPACPASKLAVRGRRGRIRGSRAPRSLGLCRARSPGRAPQCCASSSDVSGDGWGMFGVHVLRRGGRTSQNRLSDNITPLFFGRPARAGRTLTVMGLIISVRSGRRLGKSRSSSMPSSSARGKRDRLTADAGAWLGAGVVVRAGLCD